MPRKIYSIQADGDISRGCRYYGLRFTASKAFLQNVILDLTGWESLKTVQGAYSSRLQGHHSVSHHFYYQIIYTRNFWCFINSFYRHTVIFLLASENGRAKWDDENYWLLKKYSSDFPRTFWTSKNMIIRARQIVFSHNMSLNCYKPLIQYLPSVYHLVLSYSLFSHKASISSFASASFAFQQKKYNLAV